MVLESRSKTEFRGSGLKNATALFRKGDHMSTFNRITILGTLGNDPFLQATRNGRPYCRVSLATNSWRKEGGESTTWHSVHLFGKNAETASQYLKKGRQILIEGRVESSRYKTPEGLDAWRTWVTAHHMTFVGTKPKANDAQDHEEEFPSEFENSDEKTEESIN